MNRWVKSFLLTGLLTAVCFSLNFCTLQSAFAVGEASSCHGVSKSQVEQVSCHGSQEKSDFPIQKLECCFDSIKVESGSFQSRSDFYLDLFDSLLLPYPIQIPQEVKPLFEHTHNFSSFIVSNVVNHTFALRAPPVVR